MGSWVGLLIILAIVECRGDYMMGGHLDNKEQDQGMMEHRSGEEELGTSVSGSRSSGLKEADHEFDLELDLFGEQSGADPTRISIVNSSSSSGGSSSGNEERTRDEDTSTAPRFRVLPYAFNGGHPFSLEKDPITGQIDFEKAPPLKALEYHVKTPAHTEEPETESEMENARIDSSSQQDKSESLGPNEINPYSPSFHDFLNLPVRYTYDKYKNAEKFPLISNSYANTKVQSGSNSYNTYNHKKYHEAVKAGVDVQTLYVHPSRKTYASSITKTSMKPTTTTTTTRTTTTRRPSTTRKITTTTTSTTSTTPAPSTTTTTTQRSRYPAVTTWKPQEKPSETNFFGMFADYEDTLPIERLQQNNPGKQQTKTTTTTTEKSRYQTPPPRPKAEQKKPEPEENKNEEYEEGYDEDYDRILQIAEHPNQSNHNDHSNDSQDDYSYGIMDFVGGLRPTTKAPKTTSASPSTTSTESFVYTSEPTTSTTPTPIMTSNVPTTVDTREDENRTTTMKPLEEKRITSMPIDTISFNDNYRVPNYGTNGGIIGTIDNAILNNNNNNLLYQHNRAPSNDNYYQRPAIGMSPGGIVVKSTSNVVVPPGQDTVSFVLGNRQSVGSVSDAATDFYGVHSPGTMNERPSVSFGNARPVDNFGGSMIVSAGIGVGSNPIGPYHQRPSTSGNNFDHAVVTVGMPTVDIVNPGESGSNKKPDSTSDTLDTLAQKWWASTSSSANNQQTISETSQDSTSQQFGYRVVFPDEKGQTSGLVGNDNSPGTQRPVEEHVIVVHESEIANGNTLHLDLSSQSTSSPTTNFHHESTTQRLLVNTDDKLLPELSESLTPPAERPNILPSGIQRPPSYNYYHHSSHPPSNSRPNDYRGPGRLPTPPSNNFKRRPTTTIESNLPNILPQFRPNAKTSHGHNRGETIGTIPAGSMPPYANTRIRRPPGHVHHLHSPHRPATARRPSGPPHLQRLNPPPLPPPPPPVSSLRLPTPASLVASPNLGLGSQHDSVNQNSDNNVRLGGPNRLHKVSLGIPASLSIDERHHQSNGFVNSQPIKSRLEDDALERFSAEPPVRLAYFTKRTTNGESEGIPRIATLQMIQQHAGSRDEENVRPNLPPPYRFNEKPSSSEQDNEQVGGNDENSSGVKSDRRGDENQEKPEVAQQGNEATRADYVDAVDSPVYVVYPVKGALDIRPTSNDDGDQDDASVVLGTYGPQRPLPPDTLLKDSEDNDSDEDSFRAPTIVNVSPSFTDSSGPQLASDFPYPLERPDPSMFTSQLREKPLLVPSEQQKNGERPEGDANEENATEEKSSNEADGVRDTERDASVNVIPYLQDHVPFTLKENAGVISTTLHRFGANPSIVTASSTPIAYVFTPTTRTPVRRHEDPYIHGAFERGPVLLPSQQPSSSSSSAPSPQSFMAPFVASASAEAPSKNGWSVVMPGQSSGEDTSMDRRRHDSPSQENDKSTSHEGENVTQRSKHSEDEHEDEKRIREDPKPVETSQAEETDSQTEKSEFDVENFTPKLFGGFRPIFEFPSDSETDPNIGEKVTDASGSMVERPRSETG